MISNAEHLVDAASGSYAPRILFDPEIYELEMERVFGRTWLFLCHEAQLKRTGDFIATYMGSDPVIAMRQRDGTIRVYLNACRHRGMKVCRAEFGNARAFTCPYHGWSYGLDGKLIHVPHEEVFAEGLDKPGLGLVEVPRVESVFGLVWATFSSDVPSLEDYLGDANYYLEASFGRSEAGVELLDGVSKWRVASNWKLGAEQFSTDMYHVYTAHKSPYQAMGTKDTGSDETLQSSSAGGGQFSSPHGHGFGWWEPEPEESPDLDIMPALLREFFLDRRSDVVARLGESRARMESHGTIFPNFSWLYQGTPTIRVWQPKGPEEMEVESHVFVDADAPEEIKRAVSRFTVLTFGLAGLFEQDDGDIWSAIQRNLRGNQIRKNRLLNVMGLGEPRPQENGGGRLTGVVSEMGSRGYMHRWAQLIGSEAYPPADLLVERPIRSAAR